MKARDLAAGIVDLGRFVLEVVRGFKNRRSTETRPTHIDEDLAHSKAAEARERARRARAEHDPD